MIYIYADSTGLAIPTIQTQMCQACKFLQVVAWSDCHQQQISTNTTNHRRKTWHTHLLITQCFFASWPLQLTATACPRMWPQLLLLSPSSPGCPNARKPPPHTFVVVVVHSQEWHGLQKDDVGHSAEEEEISPRVCFESWLGKNPLLHQGVEPAWVMSWNPYTFNWATSLPTAIYFFNSLTTNNLVEQPQTCLNHLPELAKSVLANYCQQM